MRTLILMRGAPGCGKSTWIKRQGLTNFTLSADDIRIMCGGLERLPNGNIGISQSLNKQVWSLLYQMLEERMKLGAFTIIDATNSTKKEMENYRKLVEKYRYRVYVVDMTDIPIEKVKYRNAHREIHRIVPEEVIDKFYKRFESERVPSYYTVIKPDEFSEVTTWKPTDTSKYKKIHMIGDIHGSNTVLQEYLKDGIKEDELYIFLGDYTDRGIENVEVLQFLQRIYKKPNIVLIEGNHEKWVSKWLNDEEIQSNTFNDKTKPELDKAFEQGLLNKKKLRDMYRRMYQCFYFKCGDKNVICTHGGVANHEHLELINTDQMINGVGKYEEYQQAADTFDKYGYGEYQVNGHRNVDNLPVKVGERNFNLEGGVEWGGCLRAVTLDENGFETHEIKNNVWDRPPELTKDNLIEVLRQNRYIKEKKFGNISSFNFTVQAFREGVWDEQTCKARGLFVNTETNEIIARGYEKFFRDDEVYTSYEEMIKGLSYPLEVTIKENGFLGILSYNRDKDDFIFCTKSVMYTDGKSKDQIYVSMFREIFYKQDINIDALKDYFRNHNCTFLFEVIDPVRDPHIIEYDKEDIVLLDIVKNQLGFKKVEYDELNSLAAKFCFSCKKKLSYKIDNEEDLLLLYYRATNDMREGYVIEDSTGYMIKLKTDYYSKWKWARSIAMAVFNHGEYSKYDSLPDDLQDFHDWLIGLNRCVILTKEDKQIINLRKWFLEENSPQEEGGSWN